MTSRVSDVMSEPESGERKGGSVRIQAHGVDTADVSDQLDTVFDLLATTRRRYLLYHLTELHSDESTVETAVAGVRAFDFVEGDDEFLPRRQSIRIELVHTHLPRLDAADVLDYDRQKGEIRYLGHDQLETWLEQVRQVELG